jgi:hypothetical protein
MDALIAKTLQLFEAHPPHKLVSLAIGPSQIKPRYNQACSLCIHPHHRVHACVTVALTCHAHSFVVVAVVVVVVVVVVVIVVAVVILLAITMFCHEVARFQTVRPIWYRT